MVQRMELYCLTPGGVVRDLYSLEARDINIFAAFEALSKTNRYNGNTANFYSVAEHSVRVADWTVRLIAAEQPHLRKETKLQCERWALLHDVSEAYTGDVVAPLRRLTHELNELERDIQNLIRERARIPGSTFIANLVHRADHLAFLDEVAGGAVGRFEDPVGHFGDWQHHKPLSPIRFWGHRAAYGELYDRWVEVTLAWQEARDAGQ